MRTGLPAGFTVSGRRRIDVKTAYREAGRPVFSRSSDRPPWMPSDLEKSCKTACFPGERWQIDPILDLLLKFQGMENPQLNGLFSVDLKPGNRAQS